MYIICQNGIYLHYLQDGPIKTRHRPSILPVSKAYTYHHYLFRQYTYIVYILFTAGIQHYSLTFDLIVVLILSVIYVFLFLLVHCAKLT
jgi:hypothetical protein